MRRHDLARAADLRVIGLAYRARIEVATQHCIVCQANACTRFGTSPSGSDAIGTWSNRFEVVGEVLRANEPLIGVVLWVVSYHVASFR